MLSQTLCKLVLGEGSDGDGGVEIRVSSLKPGAWMGTRYAYWDGPVTVSGSHAGRGYLEMTGY